MTTSIDVDAALADVLDHEYDNTAAETPTVSQEPYVTALRASDLFADHSYQRDLDTFRVNQMADSYKVALVGIVEVSDRGDGTYAILDGQHRVAVCANVAFGSPNPDPYIPCRVHTGLTRRAEADLYHQLNTTRRQLTGWDRWVARRGAGDAAVLDVEAAVHRAGLVTGMGGGPTILRATSACEKVVALGGIPLLDEVLNTVRQTWPDDQAGLDGAILTGLGQVLNAYSRDELDLARAVATLSGVLPRQMTARAAAMREVHKGTLDRLTAHVIVERYNTVKGGRIEPFFDRVKPLAKAVNMKEKARLERRAAVLAWARENGWPNAKNSSKQLSAAFDAAHGMGAAE